MQRWAVGLIEGCSSRPSVTCRDFSSLGDFTSGGVVEGKQLDSTPQLIELDKLVAQERGDELDVLLPSRGKLAHGQVVSFQAPPGASPSVCILDWHEPTLPARGQDGGLRAHSVDVESVGLMKQRELSECAVDCFGPLWVVARKNVHLARPQQVIRRIRKLPEHRLAADDDQFVILGNVARRANRVLQLRASQSGGRSPAALPARARPRRETTAEGDSPARCPRPETRADRAAAIARGSDATPGAPAAIAGRTSAPTPRASRLLGRRVQDRDGRVRPPRRAGLDSARRSSRGVSPARAGREHQSSCGES